MKLYYNIDNVRFIDYNTQPPNNYNNADPTAFRFDPNPKRGEKNMPEMMIDIPIRKLAYIIDSMNSQELETLYMFLTEEGSELLERNKDLELGRVTYLSEEEAFDV
jgi:hypothetical protein